MFTHPEPTVPALEPTIQSLIQAIEADERLELADIKRSPGSPGTFAAWPASVDPRLVAVARGVGIERPYAHQARALDKVFAGHDLVMATATASGKSLVYQLPLLQSTMIDPEARALGIFPTKALTRDQAEAMRRFISSDSTLSGCAGVGVVDGDATPAQRRAAQRKASFVWTNPDMLHRSILPNHGAWVDFFAGLRYVVIDELHVYRGVFGSHVAQVLRRLWRICAHYGNCPQVIACSATIANPQAHAQALCTRSSVSLIQGADAPRGPRHFIIVNPAIVDPLTGVRADYLKATRRVTQHLCEAGIQGLVFCRTRKAVELLTRYLREDGSGHTRNHIEVPRGLVTPMAKERARTEIRGYRGGYLSELRREVEAALRDGEARWVACTNALELGVDIGGLDAVVMAGYAGSRAATWQRAGRAGRRNSASLSVLVCSSSPRDQFVASHPEFLHEGSIESARIDPDNPDILIPHLRCAAHELQLQQEQGYPGIAKVDYQEALATLEQAEILHREEARDGSVQYFALGDPSPADNVEIRGPLEENFCVVVATPNGGQEGEILAEVDFHDAPMYLHVGAIYPVEGVTYEVRRLDWDARKAFVQPVQSSFFTEAICQLKVRLIETEPQLDRPHQLEVGLAWAHVMRLVPSFKKIRFGSHETVGFGPVDLPPLELHTRAAYWALDPNLVSDQVDQKTRAAVALCLAYAMHQVGAMRTMCDPSDLGRAVASDHSGSWGSVLGTQKAGAEAMFEVSGPPVIYIYDQIPGGVGLSAQLVSLGVSFLQSVLDFVSGCTCNHGCPTCLGPEHQALNTAGALQSALLETLAAMIRAYTLRSSFPAVSRSPDMGSIAASSDSLPLSSKVAR